MARLFVQFLAIQSNENLPNLINWPSMRKMLTNTRKNFFNAFENFHIVAKFRQI